MNNKNSHIIIGIVGITLALFLISALVPMNILRSIFTSCEQVIWVLFDPHSTEVFMHVLIGIGLLALVSVLFFLVSYTRLYFRKRNHSYQNIPSGTIQVVMKRIGIEKMVHVVEDGKPFAYCVGIRHPRIYISTGLIDISTPEEMEIILRHELYHIEHHHLVVRFVIEVFRTFFLFIPVFSDLLRHIIIRQEIEADKAAISVVGTQKPLVDILAKLIRYEQSQYAAVAAIVDSFSLEERVYSLTNAQPSSSPLITWSAFARSGAILSVLFVVLFLTVPEHTNEQTTRMVRTICTSYQ